MPSSFITWTGLGMVGAGGAAGAWSYLYFSDGQKFHEHAALTFNNPNELKEFPGGVCVASLKPEAKKLLSQKESQGKEWKSLKDKFKTPQGTPEGCVAINWTKDTWDNSLWKGSIRYEWVYTTGDETIVVHGLFNSSTFSEKEDKAIFYRARYLNTKDNQWGWLNWEKPIKETNDWAKYMPQNPAKATEPEDYWRFNPDYSKICTRTIMKGGSCKDEPKFRNRSSFRWKWTGNDKSNQAFSDWSKNFDPVFSFDNTHNLNKLSQLLKEKKGIWESF